MIDVTHQINAVRRHVGSRVIEAGEAHVVTLSQTYDSTVEDLWDACTNPERIPRWFLPVTGDLRPGGKYQLQGNANGTVESCDPPRGFTATWEFAGNVSWIELRLIPAEDGGTRFELDHIAPDDDEKWAQFGPGAVGVGWDMALIGLTLHLSSGEAVNPEEAMAWFGTEEGLRFVTLSSEGWYAASVSGGEAEGVARARADRTTAAYTGADAGADGSTGEE
ncbi:SRPBCC family protein [Streptomyces sp. NBC_00878]|uniref:SRPBCC family protein n=1 Tax=Streptomyces sp. NBC_00878 TaxID=2975854 RepID=UPI0022501ABB|nr:SRPBCC family protein [Streptomyces sp. NBC_00878]MCX4906797.1 SRPBCC family protein [Streptomyces sp. NBC_00878]